MSAGIRAVTASNGRLLSSFARPINVVVVGGTSGIGQAMALAIGRHSPTANITIIGRNENVAKEMLPKLGSNGKFIRSDVSLMSEIRNASKQIENVDMLILTQGIFTTAGRTPTSENIDNKMALHYYGRVLFVQELLPRLRASTIGGRVLFVLDSVNGSPSRINWDDMQLEQSYSLAAAANHCMTFTDIIIQYFAQQPENSKVTFNHAYPGFVRTPLVENSPFWIRLPVKAMMSVGFGVTADQCAEYMLHGMLNTENGCRYINNKGETVNKKQTPQQDIIDRVWDHTLKIISSGQ